MFLQLIADGISIGAIAGLFSGNNIQAAKQVIEATISVLNIKKFLQGEKPEQVLKLKDNRVKIIGNKGQVLVVENLVLELANNTQIDKQIKQVFKPVENKETVTGISIKDHEEKVSFETKKEDGSFDYMLGSNPIIEDEIVEENEKLIDNAILSVYSLTFGDSKKWEFYYEGNKIPVELLDNDFMEKVINRDYYFANGDKIKCKMIVHQKWNKIAMIFENKSYSVIEVYGSPIPPNQQNKMDI